MSQRPELWPSCHSLGNATTSCPSADYKGSARGPASGWLKKSSQNLERESLRATIPILWFSPSCHHCSQKLLPHIPLVTRDFPGGPVVKTPCFQSRGNLRSHVPCGAAKKKAYKKKYSACNQPSEPLNRPPQWCLC